MKKHLALLLLVLSACASTKHKGQVVRLQPEIDDAQAKSAPQNPEKGPLYTLGNLGEEPSAKDDAAIFHFSMGQAYSLDSDPARSIESYRATLVHDPNSALVHARLAAELVKVGNFAEAKSLAEKAIVLDPKYLDSYLLLAGIQVAAKEYEGAISTYKKALEFEPKNRDALLYYGVTLAEVGRTKEGVAQIEKLVKLKDNNESNIDQAVAFYYLAKIYDQSNQKDLAIKALKESLKKRPSFSKAALNLSDLYKEKKDERKSIEVLEEAFKESHSADLAERLAEMSLEKNDYRGAVSFLETLVEEDPTNENMKLRLALVYWQLKWLDKSKMILVDLHDRYPNSSEISFYLGELEMERKDTDSAIAYYKLIAPDYAKYDQMVGRVVFLYRAEKQFEAGEDFLQEAISKRGDIVAFYPLLAALYEDQNKLGEAKNVLERGRKTFESDESILYYLGFLYDRMGDKEKGLSTMEKLLEINPNNANALNFVGYTLLEKNTELDKATDYLERAVALKPDDAFVLDSYGWLLHRRGNHAKAMKTLEKARSIKPEEAVIAEHLADVYVALNMPKKALAVYLSALSSGADEEFKQRVQKKVSNVQEALAETKPGPKASDRGPASR